MKKIHTFTAIVVLFLLATFHLQAQESIHGTIGKVVGPVVVNFTELAKWEATHPVPILNQEEKGRENDVAPPSRMVPLPPDAVVTKINLPEQENRAFPPSPGPIITFNGLLDNGVVIPPDVQGAAGINNLMETLNSQYAIFSKTGSTLQTLSLTTFWSGISGGTPFSDPRIVYDPNNDRFITVIIGILDIGHYAFFLGVSQTGDPTGNWYEYSIDAGPTTNIPDYPSLGFNTNWIVITDNFFKNGVNWNKEEIRVMNRASAYNGTLGTVNYFTDKTHIQVIMPATTIDASQTTEYLISDASNSNSGGNGFVKVATITGTPNAPVYNTGVTIGTNHPWSNNPIGAKQKGTSTTIESDDQRFITAIYRNGSLWGCHHVYLPASTPNHIGTDMWQIDPATNTVQQFIRIEDATGNTNYYYPSMAVNANNDVVIGYTLSGTNDYPSAGYSVRAGTDSLNTIQSNYINKAGLASYNKTFGSGRNRWGDMSESTVDPVDGTLWTLQEWAQAGSNWGTAWADVSPTSGVNCMTPTGLNVTNITANSATLNWNAFNGAVGYNIQYRPVGSGTWTTATSVSTSIAINSLTVNTQYEFQVQTDCGGGNVSAFSASVLFTTLSNGCSDVYEPNNTKGTAAPITVNTAIRALINPSGDLDFYSFSNTASQPNIEIDLTNLPADYNITLFNPGGTNVGASNHSGTANEQIKFNTSSIGTYKVKVIGKNGAFNATNCYTLQASISTSPFRLQENINSSNNSISRIYPNPANAEMNIDYSSVSEGNATIIVHDLSGKILYHLPVIVASGNNTFHIQLNSLSDGFYLLEMKSSSGAEFQKFAIQK